MAPAERAAGLYAQGKAVTARQSLVRLLEGSDAPSGEARLGALETLLDICIHSHAADCVARFGAEYAEVARDAPAANDVQRAELARKAAYYFDYGRFAQGAPAVTGQILDWAPWKNENAYNGELYLQRQLLAAKILLDLDRPEAVDGRINRILSLAGSLTNPEAARFTLAHALSETISMLVEIGQTERAYGLYRASAKFIAGALPPLSVDAAVFRLVEADLLTQIGDLRSAARVLETAIPQLERIELDEETRAWLQGGAFSLRAAVCAALGELDCAREAVRRHPLAAAYAGAGRVPASYTEVSYLAARALVGALGGAEDPVAVQALKAAKVDGESARTADRIEAYRAAGVALALPPGDTRRKALAELARRLEDGAWRKAAGGAWYRPGAVDQILIGLALAQAGPGADPETLFAVFQLAGRTGPSFDADALTALGQAQDELQRRSVHQALRLRARRDRLERERVQQVTAQAAAPAARAVLQHDTATRLVLRDFDLRIAEAESGLAKAGLALSGANLVSLKRFQSVLAQNEAALVVTPTVGGLAYLCVRRDSFASSTRAADARQMQLDARLVQAALTASHAPSERLDAQFPAASAVRLYDAMIRPFESCLRPGDRILWLPSVATAAVPLAVLLREAPPKAAAGYDLGAADWLIRRHAISYAGSASVVVAARTGMRRGADFDFLGVGDPVLTGAMADGAERSEALLRGVRGASRFEGLAPLPETRDELEASARGFSSARLLLREEATEGRFRGELVGAYRFLSFATHGLIREDLPGLTEPALVMTPVSAANAADDGLLSASEIADLNLKADFVALSACNTANFDFAQMSQELPALASAFAVAGAPATLGTLWPVDSETGKRVVAGVFERLRATPGLPPAEALAGAQRAFLAAPPGRAWLHPRFWAPFVLLGDGGAAPPASPDGRRLTLASIEKLTRNGGEALAVARRGSQVAVRYIGDANERGRHASGLRLSAHAGAEAWQREDREVGASRFMAELDGRLVVGGYAVGHSGRLVPALQAFDADGGQPLHAWRGEDAGSADAVLLGGGPASAGKALFAVGTLDLKEPGGAGGGWLQVFETDATLSPRKIFAIQAPARRLDEAILSVLGEDLLVTYTSRFSPPTRPPETTLDDYEAAYCLTEPVTWLEVRSLHTGELKMRRELRGYTLTTATTGKGGTVMLGGAFRAACPSEDRAVVLALDARREVTTLYADDSLGASEVRSLSPMPDGRIFVAAKKENVVDYGQHRPRTGPYRIDPVNPYSGLLLTLGRNGVASAPKLLDAASHIYVSGADATRPGEILLGGSLGGQAAVFSLTERAAARRKR